MFCRICEKILVNEGNVEPTVIKRVFFFIVNVVRTTLLYYFLILFRKSAIISIKTKTKLS